MWDAGAFACAKCAPGTYRDEVMAATHPGLPCAVCNASSWTNETGATDCVRCPE